MHKHNYGFDSGYLTVILIGNLSWSSTDDTLLQVCLSLRQLAFLAHVVSLQCPFSILRLGPALSFPMISWLVALHLSRLRHIRLVNVIVSQTVCVVAKCTIMAIGLFRLRYRHRRSLSLYLHIERLSKHVAIDLQCIVMKDRETGRSRGFGFVVCNCFHASRSCLIAVCCVDLRFPSGG